jgi:hypothetical protein
MVLALLAPAGAQDGGALHRPLDELLDLYVRDGLVYYRALRSDRGRLDAYLASLDGAQARRLAAGSRDEQIALWLNAYNAQVLRIVIDHYPIRGAAGGYPASSIRQIPGAFERMPHRIAGRPLTLDQIETEVLAAFRDPRLFLALGRGAVGSGRLRSEAFSGARLGAQLSDVAREFATSGRLLHIDEAAGIVSVTPILSWREPAFVGAYAGAAAPRFAQRSPLEQALLAFLEPGLLAHEREFLDRNDFSVRFQTFDWTLNELGGGRP